MIIAEIKGGLGNQMFQYATARTIADQTNNKLFLDKTFHENNFFRPFALDQFNIRIDGFVDELPKDRLISVFREKQYFQYNPNMLKHIAESKLPVSVLKGSWQNPNYFSHNDRIVKDFTLTQPTDEFLQVREELFEIQSDNLAIAVHFRRGDFVADFNTKLFHGNLGINFYNKAIKELTNQLPHMRVRLCLFSEEADYIAYVTTKNLLKWRTIPLYTGNMTDAEQIMLMSLCDHNVIANSSFSWWGAYLNQNPEKVVMAPYYWIKENHERGIHPPEWQLISNGW